LEKIWVNSNRLNQLWPNHTSSIQIRAKWNIFIKFWGTSNIFIQFWKLHDPCFQSIILETCMFLAFSPEHLCSDLSRQIKSLLSLNWQVLKVLIVKFQASTLDQCHHLLINLSCKCASKPLNATSARSAVAYGFWSQYCSWARSHRGRHYDCASYIVFTRFRCTPTQHVQSMPNSDFAPRHWHPK